MVQTCSLLPAGDGEWVNLKESPYTGVILRDFSPQEPALSEVEGISRTPSQSRESDPMRARSFANSG